MRKYFGNFFKNEDGIETLEWIALLAVAAAIIGFLATMGNDVMDYMSTIGSYL